MTAIEKLKSIFRKTPTHAITPVHQHDWITKYTTGTWSSTWSREGKTGFGKSTVVKCDCGQWAVRHTGDDVYVLLND